MFIWPLVLHQPWIRYAPNENQMVLACFWSVRVFTLPYLVPHPMLKSTLLQQSRCMVKTTYLTLTPDLELEVDLIWGWDHVLYQMIPLRTHLSKEMLMDIQRALPGLCVLSLVYWSSTSGKTCKQCKVSHVKMDKNATHFILKTSLAEDEITAIHQK